MFVSPGSSLAHLVPVHTGTIICHQCEKKQVTAAWTVLHHKHLSVFGVQKPRYSARNTAMILVRFTTVGRCMFSSVSSSVCQNCGKGVAMTCSTGTPVCEYREEDLLATYTSLHKLCDAVVYVTTHLCEGRGCGRPARVQGTHPSWNTSAQTGETSRDPVDGVSSLRVRGEDGVRGPQRRGIHKYSWKSYTQCLPAAIRRSNQRAVLSKWFAISGSEPPSRSRSTKRSCNERQKRDVTTEYWVSF